MIAGMSREELLHEALVRSRESFVPFPGLELRRRAGWVQLVTPLFRSGGFNEVALAQLEADEADAVIDATIAEYDALGIRFRWTVGPDSRPADLGARLARRGLVGERGVMMAAAGAAVAGDIGPGVTVERVGAGQVDMGASLAVPGPGRQAAWRSSQMAMPWAFNSTSRARISSAVLSGNVQPCCRTRAL